MKIPHSKPYFDDSDADTVAATLKSAFVSTGEVASDFGTTVASILGKKWGVATQSGTDALSVALRLLALAPGSKVAVPAYICTAPLDAIAMNKLTPVPVDIDKETMSVAVDMLNESPYDTAIVAHMFGIPAPVHMIETDNVIEDCAQTLKVEHNGITVGSSGRLSIASFYATKLLTTGHGGLIAGNEDELLDRLNYCFKHDKQEKWSPHLHFLMSDFNASLGLSQLKKLDFFIERRRAIAERFKRALGVDNPDTSGSIYSRFLVYSVSDDADAVINRFNVANIDAKRPVYTPLYAALGGTSSDFPVAAWVHNNIISVPIYPAMPEGHIDCIESFLEGNSDLHNWPPA